MIGLIWLNLNFETASLEFSAYTLANIFGQTLRRGNKLNQHQEDMSSFPRGIYFLKVQAALRQQVFKVVKE